MGEQGRNGRGGLGRTLLKEGSTLVPFLGFFSNVKKYWELRDKGSDCSAFRRYITNGLVSGVCILYPIISLGVGANPLKPQHFFRDAERKVIRMEQEERANSDRRFYKADKNEDLVLDPNEFYDYRRRE